MAPLPLPESVAPAFDDRIREPVKAFTCIDLPG
jgi:hypothetical protein